MRVEPCTGRMARVGARSWIGRGALAGFVALVAGGGCAGAGERGHLVAPGLVVAEEEGPAMRWTFVAESRERWHSDRIVLPDGQWLEQLSTWSWVPALPGEGEASQHQEGVAAHVKEGQAQGHHGDLVPTPWSGWYPRIAALKAHIPKGASGDFAVPAASDGRPGGSSDGRAVLPSETDEDRWGLLNRRRPRIVGSARDAEGREILEIEVAEGDRVGSISLLPVDALSGKGGSSPIVVRLPFTETSSSRCPGFHRRVSVDIEGRPVPVGTYLLVAVAESGAPSAGELLIVEPARPGD